jgi:hypothetical protein
MQEPGPPGWGSFENRDNKNILIVEGVSKIETIKCNHC